MIAPPFLAEVAELVDALDLGSSGETRAGSSPAFRTPMVTNNKKPAKHHHMLRRFLVDVLRRLGSSAPMIPRATTPATVRVSGEFITFSKVDGSGFCARPPVRAGALAVG